MRNNIIKKESQKTSFHNFETPLEVYSEKMYQVNDYVNTLPGIIFFIFIILTFLIIFL